MKQFVFILYIVLTGGMAVQAVSPLPIDKLLAAEVKKQLKNAQYSIIQIPVPSKYKVGGTYYTINAVANEELKYAYMGRVITSRSEDKTLNEGADYLDYIAFYNQRFEVQKVKVVRFSSEHGAEVCSVGWLRQFVGHSPAKTLIVGKNVDAVSGATYTVNTFTFDIQSKTYILKQIAKGN